jgi:hypothetical protein
MKLMQTEIYLTVTLIRQIYIDIQVLFSIIRRVAKVKIICWINFKHDKNLVSNSTINALFPRKTDRYLIWDSDLRWWSENEIGILMLARTFVCTLALLVWLNRNRRYDSWTLGFVVLVFSRVLQVKYLHCLT